MKLKYGIISTASITPRFIKAVQEFGDEVYAIASRSLDKAQAMANKYHVPKAYGTYDALLEDEYVDVVYIATPNNTHVSIALQAIAHHKHVIIEKPFALSEAEALSVFQASLQEDVYVMEAQKSVFLPANIKLKECLDTKLLGECHQVCMLSSFPNAYPNDHWMYQPYGGVLYGSGTYTFEYLMYLFDDPSLETQASCDQVETGAIIDAGIHLVLNEHLLADSHITMKVKTDNAATFYCEHGYFRVENYWKACTLIIHPYEGEEHICSFPVEHEMIYEVKHIHECIKQKVNVSPIMTPERTILCASIIDKLVHDETEENGI